MDWSNPLVVAFVGICAVLASWFLLTHLFLSVRKFFSRPSSRDLDRTNSIAEQILDRDWAWEHAQRFAPPKVSRQEVDQYRDPTEGALLDHVQAASRRFFERQRGLGEMWREESRLRKGEALIEAIAKEMDEYVEMLSALDGSEVAGLLAMAVHLRNGMLSDGVDLADPAAAEALKPGLTLMIAEKVQKFRRMGEFARANGPLIWLFSLVASQDPRRRWGGRRLWKELMRGFPHLEEAKEDLETMLGIVADVSGADQVPKGLAPEPE